MRHAFCIFLLLSACAPGASENPPGRSDFVDIKEVAPSVIVDARYFGEDNFLGAYVDGYEAAKCLLTHEAATALAGVQADLQTMGLSLRIYDCYRPQQAVDHFARWAADVDDVKNQADYYPTIPKSELFSRGYIAERSGHTRGSTMDLTIDGLDMGTDWDLLGELSNTANPAIEKHARANRALLKYAMEKHGFVNYDLEWWHYSLGEEPYPETYFDFPVK